MPVLFSSFVHVVTFSARHVVVHKRRRRAMHVVLVSLVGLSLAPQHRHHILVELIQASCAIYHRMLYKPMAKGEGRFSTTHSGKTTGPILIKLEI